MITTAIPPANMPYIINLRFVTWFCLSSDTEPTKLITILTNKDFDYLLVDIVSSEPSHVVCYHSTINPVYFIQRDCLEELCLLTKCFFYEKYETMI